VSISDIIRLVHAAETVAASKVKSVTSTILMNRDLHNANLAAVLSVSVRLGENRLREFYSVNRNITIQQQQQQQQQRLAIGVSVAGQR